MSTPDGDKSRNRIPLKGASIPNIVPNAQPIPQGSVRSKPPSERVALKPLVGNGLPKYGLRSVPNPSQNNTEGNSIPNTSVNNSVGNHIPNKNVNSGVQSSIIRNGVNSAHDQ